MPGPKACGPNVPAPKDPNVPRTAEPDAKEAAPAPIAEEKRTELNLLGQTDVQAGESRRNENIQFNLIDNNALKDLNARLGTSATAIYRVPPRASLFRNGIRQTSPPDSSSLTPPGIRATFTPESFSLAATASSAPALSFRWEA